MAGVPSVDPSSTTTQSAGCTDCAATLSSVRRRYWASSRQGEMSKYRREGFTWRTHWTRDGGHPYLLTIALSTRTERRHRWTCGMQPHVLASCQRPCGPAPLQNCEVI